MVHKRIWLLEKNAMPRVKTQDQLSIFEIFETLKYGFVAGHHRVAAPAHSPKELPDCPSLKEFRERATRISQRDAFRADRTRVFDQQSQGDQQNVDLVAVVARTLRHEWNPGNIILSSFAVLA